MKTFEALLEHIDGLWIVDTHEHMPMEADRPTESDVLAEYVRHYFSSDLVSAGLASDELEAARGAFYLGAAKEMKKPKLLKEEKTSE